MKSRLFEMKCCLQRVSELLITTKNAVKNRFASFQILNSVQILFCFFFENELKLVHYCTYDHNYYESSMIPSQFSSVHETNILEKLQFDLSFKTIRTRTVLISREMISTIGKLRDYFSGSCTVT